MMNGEEVKQVRGEVTEVEGSLDWSGPDDPTNPKNWPMRKRIFNTTTPAILGFLITLTTSSYVPGIPFIIAEFQVSHTVATLGLSLYIFGIALGPLCTAPLSELYGRKPVYVATLACLLAFEGGVGAARNIQTLLVCRFLAGLLGSGALAIGAGTIADIWDLSKDGGPASLGFIICPFLGPVLGYLTGAYTITSHGNNWRWSVWIILIIGAPIFIALLFLSESSKPHILASRTSSNVLKRLRGYRSQERACNQLRTAIFRPLHMLFTEPIVACVSIYTGFTFAMMFSFFDSYLYVFIRVYDFNAKEIGLTFIGILPGLLLAVVTFGYFDKTVYARARAAANGNPAPEHRLYAAMVGSLILPIGLFWFAWAPRHGVHWIVPVLSGIPFGWGMLAIFLSSTTYLLDVYRSSTGASAIAANGILRYVFGGAFPLFTLQMYERLGTGWAGTVFASVSILLMPIPWVFFRYGSAIRARSGYDTFRD